jgi:hypothetical protein
MIYLEKFHTREQAKKRIFVYVTCFYNGKRIHSAIGYMTPNQWERTYYLSAWFSRFLCPFYWQRSTTIHGSFYPICFPKERQSVVYLDVGIRLRVGLAAPRNNDLLRQPQEYDTEYDTMGRSSFSSSDGAASATWRSIEELRILPPLFTFSIIDTFFSHFHWRVTWWLYHITTTFSNYWVDIKCEIE